MSYTHAKFNYGFTLLELVLVLFILAILTTTSLSFIESEDGQLRYDESINKLNFISDALLKERTHQNSTFYAGFVSDNGLIPPNTVLDPLTDNTTAWSLASGNEWISYASITPYYYNTDGAGSEVELNDATNPEFNLFKGFRGPYLVKGRDSINEFLDGWGHNFVIASASNVFDYTFNGDDVTDPKPLPFNIDIDRSLEETDWTIAPTALNITIENNSGALVNANSYEVAVAIFVNDAVDTVTFPEDRWQSFHFTQDAAINTGGTYSSSSGSWNLGGTAITTERVPVGEHIALLVDRSVTGVNIDGVAEITDSVRFTVFASVSNQPEVILEAP